MLTDMDDQSIYIQRMEASARQRKQAAENRDGTVNPNQERTLLIREVDTMNEDEIIQLFHPEFKDDIESIRLFPPIPGTRGFAFIEFKDTMIAIRAMNLRHRKMFTYRGAPKRIFLSRVTGFKQEDEMKWKKYQERQIRNKGREEFDSTPRRVNFTKTGQPYRPPGSIGAPFSSPVQTIPFSEIQARAQELAENPSAARNDPPASSSGEAFAAIADAPEAEGDRKEGDAAESSRRRSPPRDRAPAEPARRRASPERRRSPPRDRHVPPRRDADRHDDRRRADSRDRRDRDVRDRREPPAREREAPRRNPFVDDRDRRVDDRDRRDDRRDDRYRESRDQEDRDRRARDPPAREEDVDDRKRRRVDEDDAPRARSTQQQDPFLSERRPEARRY